ncbi:protein FAM227A isoform X4 [Myotis yumanensis]
MWLDSFWWIFHERYQRNREVQNKLFERISQQYASLLLRGARPDSEEAILKRLPSLLSKGLYTSFSSCFPQSWLNTHEFKSDICNTMSLWISGIYPSPLGYDTWDYSNLDPERFRREGLMSRRRQWRRGKQMSFLIPKAYTSYKAVHSGRVPCSQWTSGHLKSRRSCLSKNSEDTSQSQNTSQANITLTDHGQTQALRKATQVKKRSEARIYENMLPKKSHPACKIPEMSSNLFNIYGKSPLVVYYLLNYATLRQCGRDVLMTRTEITRTVPESSLTYADVINLTLCNMKKRRDNLLQLTQFRCNEWSYFDEYLAELQDNFLKETKNLDQRQADKRRANRTFIPPPAFYEETLEKKPKANQEKETEFLLRREKEEEERQRHKLYDSSLPLSSHHESSYDDSDFSHREMSKSKAMQKKTAPNLLANLEESLAKNWENFRDEACTWA